MTSKHPFSLRRLSALLGSLLRSSSVYVLGLAVIGMLSVGVLIILDSMTGGEALTVISSYITIVIGTATIVWSQFNSAWNFQAAATPSGIRMRYGLTSDTSRTLPPGRVHGVGLTGPILWRRKDWWKVDVTVAGREDRSQDGQNRQFGNLLLPVGVRDTALRALWLVVPDLGVPDPDRLPHSCSLRVFGLVYDAAAPFENNPGGREYSPKSRRCPWWHETSERIRHMATQAITIENFNETVKEGIVLLGYRTIAVGAVAQLVGEAVEVDALQKFEDSLCTHFCDELIWVAVLEILIFARELSQSIEIFVFGQQIVDCEIICKSTRLYDNITFVVDDLIELLGGDTEKVTHLIGKRTEIPDVRDRNHQIDMSYTLSSYFFLGNFYPASVADDTAIADTLVLTTVALEVLDGTEDALAEEPITLRLVGTVVDGLGLQHFAAGVL